MKPNLHISFKDLMSLIQENSYFMWVKASIHLLLCAYRAVVVLREETYK